MNILGLTIISKKKYRDLESELCRLKDIEVEYLRLTDRDEKGRFVRKEFN